MTVRKEIDSIIKFARTTRGRDPDYILLSPEKAVKLANELGGFGSVGQEVRIYRGLSVIDCPFVGPEFLQLGYGKPV